MWSTFALERTICVLVPALILGSLTLDPINVNKIDIHFLIS